MRFSLCMLVTVMMAALFGGPDAAALDLDPLLPRSEAVSGWRMQGKPAGYTRSTLYDYIDGGADFYLSYGFRRALVADYVGPGPAKITVELYDMGSSYDAFGVFAHDPAGESAPVGQESSWSGGLLTYWKDNLFARLFADNDSDPARDAILKLGKMISKSVRSMGKKPPLLRLLPPGFIAGSVRYVHTDTALNSVLYLPGNPLGLSGKTALVYAEYPGNKDRAKLMVVSYPDGQTARAGFVGLANLLQVSLRGAPSDQYVGHTDRYQHAGALVRGRYLAVVASAPTRELADRLRKGAGSRMPSGRP